MLLSENEGKKAIFEKLSVLGDQWILCSKLMRTEQSAENLKNNIA